jgi:hypothetical protein
MIHLYSNESLVSIVLRRRSRSPHGKLTKP